MFCNRRPIWGRTKIKDNHMHKMTRLCSYELIKQKPRESPYETHRLENLRGVDRAGPSGWSFTQNQASKGMNTLKTCMWTWYVYTSVAFSYWFDKPWFHNWEKTCYCAHHTFLLGFPTGCTYAPSRHGPPFLPPTAFQSDELLPL
jgi:hypothetical protein